MQNATTLALTASELLALVRIFCSILHHPACREKVEQSAQVVSNSIHAMLRSYTTPVPPTVDSSARLAHQAIHQLLKQVKSG